MLLPLIALGAGVLYMATRPKKTGQAITVTGPSGTPYATAVVNSGIDPVTKLQSNVVDVYLLPNGTPVLRYEQVAATNARTFIMSNMAATDPILIRAKADFGLQ